MPGKIAPVLQREQRRTVVADPRIDDRAGARKRRLLHAARLRRCPAPERRHYKKATGRIGAVVLLQATMDSSPASLDRYAGLTGPAAKVDRRLARGRCGGGTGATAVDLAD